MDSERIKTVVISGGSGFIGTHLSKYLIANGYEVYLIVRNPDRIPMELLEKKQIHITAGDMQDLLQNSRALPDYPDAFFHLAWTGVSPDQRNNYNLQLENVHLSLTAVKLAYKIHAGKFIFPGSTMEYAYNQNPIDRNTLPDPVNAYGVAKLAAHYACSLNCNELGISFIYTVISGIYSEDRRDDNVIYYVISKLLHGERPSLTRLEQKWDYIHIDDVVRGLKLMAEKGRANAFYPLGHGDNLPLSNYILLIRELIDPLLPLGLGDIPYKQGRIPCSCVNVTELNQDTGFVPKIPFEDGIKGVIRKMKDRESMGHIL